MNRSTLNIRATGRTVLSVDGNLTTCSFSITVDPGAELDIFVRGRLESSASTILGDPTRPVALRRYVGQTTIFNSVAKVNANLYAPASTSSPAPPPSTALCSSIG